MAERIQAIETCYQGFRFRSRTEARWAVFFDALGLAYRYEPEGFKLKDGDEEVYYLPDFYLPTLKTWFEVKGLPPSSAEEHKCWLLSRAKDERVLLAYGGIPQPKAEASDTVAIQSYQVGQDTAATLSWVDWPSFEPDAVWAAYRKARGARFEHGETPDFDDDIEVVDRPRPKVVPIAKAKSDPKAKNSVRVLADSEPWDQTKRFDMILEPLVVPDRLKPWLRKKVHNWMRGVLRSTEAKARRPSWGWTSTDRDLLILRGPEARLLGWLQALCPVPCDPVAWAEVNPNQAVGVGISVPVFDVDIAATSDWNDYTAQQMWAEIQHHEARGKWQRFIQDPKMDPVQKALWQEMVGSHTANGSEQAKIIRAPGYRIMWPETTLATIDSSTDFRTRFFAHLRSLWPGIDLDELARFEAVGDQEIKLGLVEHDDETVVLVDGFKGQVAVHLTVPSKKGRYKVRWERSEGSRWTVDQLTAEGLLTVLTRAQRELKGLGPEPREPNPNANPRPWWQRFGRGR